jgi:ankyrin repeat protein
VLAKLLLNYDADRFKKPLTSELEAYHTVIFKPTAIHAACYLNNIDIVAELYVDEGIDWTDTRFAVTPLHVAIMKGHVDVVRLLIERGAGIFAVDTDGRSALHLACCFGRCDVLHLLLVAFLGPRNNRIRVTSTIKECLHWEERSKAKNRR